MRVITCESGIVVVTPLIVCVAEVTTSTGTGAVMIPFPKFTGVVYVVYWTVSVSGLVP